MNAQATLCPECPTGEPPRHQPFSLVAAAPTRSAATPGAWFAKLRRSFQAWQRRRQAVDALQVLDDRTLKDIGIDRSEIRSVVMEHQATEFRSRAAPDRPAEWAVNLPRARRS